MGKGDGAGSGAGDGSGDYKGKTERVAVPAMPMPMAVICCVINFLLPGFGTIIAGFASFCCSRNEDMDMSNRVLSCFASFGIGLLQLLGTIFFLLGWIWSCAWGIFFIGMSAEYYHNNNADDRDGVHQIGGTRVTRGHVIQQQPITGVLHTVPNQNVTMVNGQTVVMLNQHSAVGRVTMVPMNQAVATTSGQYGAQYGEPVGQMGAPPPYSAIQSKQVTGNQVAPEQYPPGPPPAPSMYDDMGPPPKY